MSDDRSTPPSGDVVSLRLDDELAAEVDWIASQDGVSRSQILRRLLLSSLQTETRGAEHCVRELVEIGSRLERIQAKLEDLEADDAAEAVEDLADALVLAINEVEDFEPDDE